MRACAFRSKGLEHLVPDTWNLMFQMPGTLSSKYPEPNPSVGFPDQIHPFKRHIIIRPVAIKHLVITTDI